MAKRSVHNQMEALNGDQEILYFGGQWKQNLHLESVKKMVF